MVPHVCRLSDGGTAGVWKGASGLRGISTNAEQVAVWVGNFSTCAYLDLVIEAMYCQEDAGEKPFDGGRMQDEEQTQRGM